MSTPNIDFNEFWLTQPHSKDRNSSFSPSSYFDTHSYASNTASLDILRPLPESLEAELEGLNALENFELPTFAPEQPLRDFSSYFGDFRGAGPGSVITVSSESQYDLDTASFYSSHDSYLTDNLSSLYDHKTSPSLYGSDILATTLADLNFAVPSMVAPKPTLHPAINASAMDAVNALITQQFGGINPPSTTSGEEDEDDSDGLVDQLYQTFSSADESLAPASVEQSRKRVHTSSPDEPHARPQQRARISEEADDGPAKRFKCTNCTRSFARQFNLKTHMATHDPNREKPHVCEHDGCKRRFSRKHDLGRHYTSIHGVKDVKETSQSTSPVASSSRLPRVWCDGCGRGWLKGAPDACECDDDK